MQSLFINQSAHSVPLNVVRENGSSTFYFALPVALNLGQVEAVMQFCKNCSERHGAQFQGMVTDEISPKDKTVLHYVGRVLAWRRNEKKLIQEMQTILQSMLFVQVVTVYRQRS